MRIPYTRMRRKRTGLYVTALAITTVVFILGILLGMVMEEKRINYVEMKYGQDKLNYESLQLQYLYLATLSERDGCNAFSATLNSYMKTLEETRVRLEGYSDDVSVFPDEFAELRRRYVISELNYWLLAKKMRGTCESDQISVLYFYSPDCGDCVDQGYVLDYLKRVFKDKLLVFALDASFENEPMIPIVYNTFNVTKTPAVVVDGEKYEGFTSKEKFMKILCKKYETAPEECR